MPSSISPAAILIFEVLSFLSLFPKVTKSKIDKPQKSNATIFSPYSSEHPLETRGIMYSVNNYLRKTFTCQI